MFDYSDLFSEMKSQFSVPKTFVVTTDIVIQFDLMHFNFKPRNGEDQLWLHLIQIFLLS